MPPPQDIVKVAIERPGAFAQLIELDQKKPLSAVIKDICYGWNISDSENYALHYTDGNQMYITEKNRNEIKNGAILKLTDSASKTAQLLVERIRSTRPDDRLDALKTLARLSVDVTFASEFIKLDGIGLLTRSVETGTTDIGENLAYTLTAFVELMDHSIMSWESFTQGPFVKKVVCFATRSTADATVLQRSLAILESMIQSGNALSLHVASEISIQQLQPHLSVSNQEIQIYTIAVINALFMKATAEKKQNINYFQKTLRPTILNTVIRSNRPSATDMAHQLYVLQTLSLNLLEDRMMTKLDPQDQVQRDLLMELRKIAFDSDVDQTNNSGSIDKRKSMFTQDYKKLGFLNSVNPALDFTATPPGILALDCMLYFAKQHQDSYIRLVLENSCREDRHECPFGRSSIELTRIMCEIMRIREPPSETGQDYYPMYFTHDNAFQELFCVCVQLLNKTWKEMRATFEDFDKVLQVVREQIVRCLLNKPNSMDQFRVHLHNLGYAEILKIRQSERMNQEEGDFKAAPIIELREKILPEVLELIKQQRLNRLCEGTTFRKIGKNRRQDKLWYCRLSPNHKVLHYADVEEGSKAPAIEALQEKLPIADIKMVVTGKDCPHMKEVRKSKDVMDLAFSILYDPDESLNFIAKSPDEYCVWTDGLNALLGREMVSKATCSDLEVLLNMEMKLRLLDLENIQIPETAPVVPVPPSNYDFTYDFS
uniref:LOW QUALITY PROTEIN: engulfment and cell motility protein 1-like n=1 Tax=Petromyzon marinus TaxID=7757 RepID=A0AAJ7X159_PETMA|nr:LOW QUALITY PROTEIN: engulfment and cell motility protein 1-like [Petromyzon marinus]